MSKSITLEKCQKWSSIALVLLLAVSAQATITVGSWTPIYKGVEHATGEADSGEPRLQKVNALRIDLNDPDIEFYTTPSNGGGGDETDAQKTSQFLTTNNLQVAINANFFSPACNWGSGGTRDLDGLAISQGVEVSPQEADPRANSLLITQDNQASFGHTPINTTGIYTAVTGDIPLVSNGNNLQAGTGGEAHPRTVMGISQDSRYVIWITIDGRQTGYSEGATLDEAAQWLIRFGAYSGYNLDGGGSTTMVKSDGGSGATVLNSPMGSGIFCSSYGERYNGNNIGVWALPIPPAPISDVVGMWLMDDAAGSSAADSSGLNRTGTLHEFPTDNSQWVTGKSGVDTALEFDGTNDYVQISNYRGIQGQQSRTITAWIKTNALGHIASWGNSGISGAKWLMLLQSTNGAIRVSVGNGWTVGSTDLRDGQWHHIAAVLENDGSPNANEIELYVDGVEETITSVGPVSINTSGIRDVKLGIWDVGNGVYFSGTIDDFAIFDFAMTTDQIVQLAVHGADSYLIACGKDWIDGDANLDCWVDIEDLSMLAEQWLKNEILLETDFERNDNIDMEDFSVLFTNWLMYNPVGP